MCYSCITLKTIAIHLNIYYILFICFIYIIWNMDIPNYEEITPVFDLNFKKLQKGS